LTFLAFELPLRQSCTLVGYSLDAEIKATCDLVPHLDVVDVATPEELIHGSDSLTIIGIDLFDEPLPLCITGKDSRVLEKVYRISAVFRIPFAILCVDEDRPGERHFLNSIERI
jgi:hypothetical protein